MLQKKDILRCSKPSGEKLLKKVLLNMAGSKYMFPLLDDKSPKTKDGQTPLDLAEKKAKDKGWHWSEEFQKVAGFIKEMTKR
jgi:hypothetical protein